MMLPLVRLSYSSPTRGLDWLIEIWVNIISLKLPWQKCMSILRHYLQINLLKYKN